MGADAVKTVRPRSRAAQRQAARGLLAPLASIAVYFAARPLTHSDSAALAVAGAVPAAYSIVAAVLWRRIEPFAVLSAAGFALACVVSLLAGGSALPLKLHEAALMFALGIALLAAALMHRPIPIGRLLKAPHGRRSTDETLGVLIGAFLVLHALLQLTMALTMSTTTYLTVGRVIAWAVLAGGAVSLWTCLRHLRRSVTPAGEAGKESSVQLRNEHPLRDDA
jgi:hypothetical protein